MKLQGQRTHSRPPQEHCRDGTAWEGAGDGHPGELQCCSALWMLQREENKDKFRKEMMREAHLMAFNFSRVRLPRMWVFIHLTWLVWVFMKCLLEPQKPDSRVTQVCCHSHVTALRIATAVCTTPHPWASSLAFHCPKGKDRSRWMLATTTASASVPTSPYLRPLLPLQCLELDQPHPFAPLDTPTSILAKPSLLRLVQ